jgi:hypothetical protein
MAAIGNKRTVKNTYFDDNRMLIYDLNSQLNGKVMLASLMGIFAQKVPT